MGAIVNALYGTPLDTGIDPLSLARLSIYWEQVCLTHIHLTHMTKILINPGLLVLTLCQTAVCPVQGYASR